MSSEVDIKQLFEAGAHFGHRTSRWHPKMAGFIHSTRGGVHIIDLEKTVDRLNEACKFIEKLAAEGKTILFVGTKRQARELVAEAAGKAKMPYVNQRWLGGTLTNFSTMLTRLSRLKDLEKQMESGELAEKYSKLETLHFSEEITKLTTNFGGIKNMSETPGAVVLFGAHDEPIAIKEAKNIGIPVIALVDSNTDPSVIDYPIPANDDAIKTLSLVADSVVEAILRGRLRVKAVPAEEVKEAKI